MKTSPSVPDRRGFLKASLLGGAAGVASAAAASAAPAAAPPAPGRAPIPTEARAQAEAGAVDVVGADAPEVAYPGSDFMVELLKAAGIDYVACMPGSTFRGLQESIVTYGGNRAPELISCVHEEISAAMAHGYAKMAGKPMACLVHSQIGLQHASMAVYNAYCDKAPMMVLAGNNLDAATRRPGVEWVHSQADLGVIVRDYVKWDDTPVSLQHYAESFMRAVEMSMTPPYEPVLIVADNDLQEHPVEDRARLTIPRRAPVSAPAGEPAAVERAAALLVAAEHPVIVVDRVVRTPEGVGLLVTLAELLNAPVADKGGRFNMPSNHPLNHSSRQGPLIAQADVILALELTDLFGLVNALPDLTVRTPRPVIGDRCKVIGVSANYAFMKGNIQDIQRYYAADLTIAADGQACLPQLIEAVRRQLTPERRQAVAARAAPLRDAFDRMRADAAAEAALSWDASPIGTGRLCMEIWEQIKGSPWALVSSTGGVGRWPQRLWDMTEPAHYIGDSGGYGVGYGLPAAAGAALALRDTGRIPVAIQTDGDLMVLPGTLWTLAHHRIPLLMVMHNNRAWHQETMHLQRMANRRDRGVENATVGTVISDPDIDYAQMARSMGVWAEGPISDPRQLGGALSRALAVVRSGKPALLDTLTQPR